MSARGLLARAILLGGIAPVASAAQSEARGAPTFARDVAPIVHRSCAPCHRTDGSGPFPLLSYDDVSKRARQLELVLRDRYMPPWVPVPGYGDFLDERRLPDEENATFLAWIAAGTPLGNPEELPPAPVFESRWKLGEPDVVLEMPEAYMVPAEGMDHWRTFVVPTAFSDARWLRAVDFRPGNERAVHHFIMYIDRSGETRTLDAQTPGVGFEGMRAEAGLLGEELFGWLPGMTPRPLPAGVAARLTAGADLVLDTHFVPTGKPEPVRMQIGLYYAAGPPEVLPANVILIGPGATIPPGRSGYTIGESIELPVPVEVVSIAPHAHKVCKAARVWATRPDGQRVELLRIDDWDANWQDIYRYREMVRLPAGTRIEMAFTYDNSEANERNPFQPPHRVVTGVRSQDEMAIAWLTVVVRNRDDQERLKTFHNAKYRADSERATDLIALWSALVLQFDADGDGSLDPAEDERATAYVNTLWERPKHLLAGFDDDKNGVLDAVEEERARRLVANWNGEPAR